MLSPVLCMISCFCPLSKAVFHPLLVSWSPVVFNEKTRSALAAADTSPRYGIGEGRLWQQHTAINLMVRARKDQISIYCLWKCNLLILGAWKGLVVFLPEDNDRHFVTISPEKNKKQVHSCKAFYSLHPNLCF